eukprot:2202762-Rhodomonas_salina.1
MVVAEATFVNVFLGKGQSAAVNEEAVMGLALLGTTGELRFQVLLNRRIALTCEALGVGRGWEVVEGRDWVR